MWRQTLVKATTVTTAVVDSIAVACWKKGRWNAEIRVNPMIFVEKSAKMSNAEGLQMWHQKPIPNKQLVNKFKQCMWKTSLGEEFCFSKLGFSGGRCCSRISSYASTGNRVNRAGFGGGLQRGAWRKISLKLVICQEGYGIFHWYLRLQERKWPVDVDSWKYMKIHHNH